MGAGYTTTHLCIRQVILKGKVDNQNMKIWFVRTGSMLVDKLTKLLQGPLGMGISMQIMDRTILTGHNR
jgi:hypothetical protein